MKNYLVSMFFKAKRLPPSEYFLGTPNNRLYIQQVKKKFTPEIHRKFQTGVGKKFIILDPRQKQNSKNALTIDSYVANKKFNILNWP